MIQASLWSPLLVLCFYVLRQDVTNVTFFWFFEGFPFQQLSTFLRKSLFILTELKSKLYVEWEMLVMAVPRFPIQHWHNQSSIRPKNNMNISL